MTQNDPFKALAMFLSSIFLGIGGCLGGTGCAMFKGDQLGNAAQAITVEVIKPTMEKLGNELASQSASLQGQASAINPGYVVEGFASWGPAVTYKFAINIVGVSANVAGATQAAKTDGNQ